MTKHDRMLFVGRSPVVLRYVNQRSERPPADCIANLLSKGIFLKTIVIAVMENGGVEMLSGVLF